MLIRLIIFMHHLQSVLYAVMLLHDCLVFMLHLLFLYSENTPRKL